MAGYTRQSAADIVAGQVIKAAPVHNEFQQVQTAFASLTGHKHDGSTGEGGYVPLIADVDALNKVVVDTANNRVSFYTEVSGVATEQLRIQDGAVVPVADDDIDLGASGAEFKDLYIDGIGYIDSVVITGGTIDNTVIGGTTPAAADFTTMDTTGNASVGGTFDVTGTSTFTGAISAGSLTTTGNSTHATVDINGGAIDGAIIGASSAAAGSFTTVSTSGQATLATADINGGTIDGSVIGGTTPQAVTGTTITANTGFSGALTGNVTGNVTGNLTGDVTGDVTGDLTGNVTAATGTTTLNDLVVNGTVDFTSTALLNVSDPTADQHAATKIYTDTADALKLDKAGGTMSGDITMGGNTVTGLGTPSASSDAVSKSYADAADSFKLNLSGGTMSGAIAMGGSKITGLGTPSADSDAATKGFVDTSIASVIDAAPAALDTLNELAAALGDDASFSTTVTNSIATKLPLAGGTMTGDVTLGANKATSTATPATDDTLTRKGYVDDQDATKLDLAGGTMTGDITMGANAVTSTAAPTTDDELTRKGYVDTQDALKLNLSGGTMSGAIAMGTSKVTGLGDPTANQDAATKLYTDTQDATKLNLSGGTLSGALDMGANKITTTYTPTNNADLTTKTYVDGILGSATSSAASAAAAATSETNAATSETNAGNSAAAAAASYDDFDDRYLGAKSSDPSVDNDGDALVTGALYWSTTFDALKIYTGSAWNSAAFTLGDALTQIAEDTTPQLGGDLDLNNQNITGTGNITLTGTVDGRDVSADGSKLDTVETNADVTDTDNVTAAGALMDSEVTNLDQVKTFSSSDYATAAQGLTADAALPKAGGTMTGNLILNADPTTSLGAATKEYVDTIAAAGIHYHDPVRVEHPSNLNATYNNGTAGVGATLTNAGTNAALVLDDVSMTSGDRVLVANQTDQTQNGIYTVTTVGDGSTAWVLTRSTDTDTSGPSDPNAFGKGDAFFIKEGTTNAGHLDVMTVAGTITFGTTNIVFAEVAETSIYSAGTDITLSGTTFNLNSTIAADTTGNAATATALETARNIAVTGAVTGNASFDGSGNISIATTATSDPTVTLTGAVTGSGTMTNLGNVSIATTATADPTLTLSGDVSGSATFTNLGNATLSVTVADDSHNHVISNVDGLQTALNAKYDASNPSGYTTYSANQSLNTNNSPTFSNVYVNDWFRNNASGDGMYNQATAQHWYSDHDDWWNVAGGGSANGIRFRDDHNSTVRGSVYATSSNEIGFLDSDSQWAIKHVRDSRTEFFINNSEKMQLDSSNLTVHHGSVVLGGTGRIQGVDTVSSGTDAANKSYVDTAVAAAGVSMATLYTYV
jgi:cytoskeletal protein CcmA (bactofilin family)